MFCSVLSAAISGVEAVPVWVEADVSDGMPVFSMVGHVTAQVKESTDRVRTALRNLNIFLPPKRITINLAPGDLRKEGSRFDLPIAAAVLEALGRIPQEALEGVMVLGELHLDGRVEKVTGVLPSVLNARQRGCRACVIPSDNLREGKAVSGVQVFGIKNLRELISYCRGEKDGGQSPVAVEQMAGKRAEEGILEARAGGVWADKNMNRRIPDFDEIKGQETVKRAAMIAAAGFHNLLLSGPPGSGKSMAAQRIPGILPEMSRDECLEVTKIYSVAGLLPGDVPILTQRPYRAPHYTVSPQALCGGGRIPGPGEVTLAHRGVLFLDELPEMAGRTLELLRQPLEEYRIVISRTGGTYHFPARFLLVAAMNSCPCGCYPDISRCTCTPREILAYRQRVSQPILDRIDLRVEVPASSYQDLRKNDRADGTSEAIRRRVSAACEAQRERFGPEGILFNSEIPAGDLDKFCPLTGEGSRLMEAAFRSLKLSARGYHRILRVARTIADLEGADTVSEAHVSEAVCYRQQNSSVLPAEYS